MIPINIGPPNKGKPEQDGESADEEEEEEENKEEGEETAERTALLPREESEYYTAPIKEHSQDTKPIAQRADFTDLIAADIDAVAEEENEVENTFDWDPAKDDDAQDRLQTS